MDWPSAAPAKYKSTRERVIVRIVFDRLACRENTPDIVEADASLEHAANRVRSKDQSLTSQGPASSVSPKEQYQTTLA
jgi:hypothetical protein